MNKERTILYLFSINAIIYIASGFYTPFLSAYYAQKGIDAEKIGILLMIGPCVVLLTQMFWAKISDRTGKRKEVLLVTIVRSGFSMLLYYLGNSFLCMFFATVVLTSFTTAVIPLSDAILIARSLKEGYSYSIIRLGGTLGYAVMTICAGMYLKTRPQMQFVFAFFAYMILFCFCIGLKEERNGQIVINEVVQENEGFSLVKCILETGRTHQIRVHMSSIGHPLVGDTLYSSKSEPFTGQALSCIKLQFNHPISNTPLTFTQHSLGFQSYLSSLKQNE